MSKNLTLKGAAFGALVALSISAVAPASAAGLADTSFVSLTPKTGTEYAVLAGAGNTFTLTANEASSIVGGDVKHLVTDTSDLIEVGVDTTARAGVSVDQTAGATYIWDTDLDQIEIAVDGTGLTAGDMIAFSEDIKDGADVFIAAATPVKVVAVTSTTSITLQAAASSIADASSQALVGTNATSTVVREARDATDHTFVVDSGVHTSSTNEDLVLVSDSAVTRSVTVQTWVDANDNDVINTNEYASPVRTVQFIKASEVVATTALTQPEVGDDTLNASVTTVPVLNGNQVLVTDAAALKVAFTRQGSATSYDDTSASWSDTTKKFSFSMASDNSAWDGLVIAGTYSAKGYVGTTEGAASTLAVGAATADNLTATVASTANVTYGQSTANDAVTTVEVRKATTDAVIKVAVLDEDDLPVAAGVRVKATVSSLLGTGTYKVNGTTVVSTESVSASTDATGTATFTVTSSAALAANGVTVDFTSEGISAAADLAQITLDWNAASYSVVDVDQKSASVYRSINKGGSHTFNYAVIDQFAQALTGDYRLKLVLTSFKSQTLYSGKLVGGRTSVTVTDDAGTNGTGTIIVNGALQSFESSAWADADGTNDVGAAALTQVTVNVIAAQTDAITLTADVDAASSPGTSDKDANVADTVVGAFDSRFQLGLKPSATDNTDGAEATVEIYNDEVALVAGTVSNSVTAAAKSGAQVTISGVGLTFREGANDIWAKDSLAVFASNTGSFSFEVITNKAVKDQVVTVTVGAVTKTVKLTFTALTAKTAEFVGGQVYSAGRTIPLSVQFKDKWGNLTIRGLADNTAATATFATADTDGGWLVNDAAVTAVAGKSSTKLISAVEDAGVYTITAVTNVLDSSATPVAIELSRTVLVGVTAKITKPAKGATVTVKNVKGATIKVVRGSKSISKVATSSSQKVVLKSGTGKVNVYVNGVKVASK